MLTLWQNWATASGFRAGFLLGGQRVGRGRCSASQLGFCPFPACLAQPSLFSRPLLQTSLPRALRSSQRVMGIKAPSFPSPISRLS